MRAVPESTDATPVASGQALQTRSQVRERDAAELRGSLVQPHERAQDESAQHSTLAEGAAARRVVEALVARGVDLFFGIPGGPVCPIFEAIRLTPGARLVESRHETHAAFSAALYQRASKRTPAVVVTAGPGITNAVTGIASASLECTPMLVIAGDVAWATTGGRMAQDSGPEGISTEHMLAPITRVQIRATRGQSAASQALAALDGALDPAHPGPALFVLPLDRAMEPCPKFEVVAPRRHLRVAEPAAQAVTQTAHWLQHAERPLLVFGAGCRGHEAALRALVEKSQLPFVTTPRSKGLVSESHPCSLRNGGMAASMWARRYTKEPVDVCLALGTDLDDTSMGPTRYLGPEGCLIHVDRDARVFGRNLPTQLAVVAEVGTFIEELSREDWPAAPSLTVARALADARSVSPFDIAEPALDDAVPVRPHRLLAELEAAAGPHARFVSDIGEHMLFALHYLTATACDHFYVQLNLGSMGSGIAGAIGLALADRSRPVICIAGDGGMQMAGMEALVALRERLPILFVVFNDGRYNMVHHGMRQIFGQANPYDTPPIDFAAWARALGLNASIIRRPGELSSSALSALMADGSPALLDVRMDASVRVRGGGRVEALQHMSMLSMAREPSKESA